MHKLNRLTHKSRQQIENYLKDVIKKNEKILYEYEKYFKTLFSAHF